MRNTTHKQLVNQGMCCPVCEFEDARPLLHELGQQMIKCRGCGLIYLHPRPAPEDLVQRYGGDRTDLAREERVGEWRKQRFKRFLKEADLPGRLLDIGCGCGFFLKLAQEAGWEVIGVDLNAHAVTYAKTRFQVDALCGDPRDMHFPDGSFDLVTLWNVLDHAPDPRDLLLEVHRVLKDDGRVFIRTPNVAWHWLSYRLVNFLSRLGLGNLFDHRPHAIFIFHQTNFSPSNLRLVLDRSGLAPMSIRNSSPIPGDPYLGTGLIGKRMVALAKLGVYNIAQGLALVSGGRWLIGPSLEAWGRRGRIHETI